MIGTMERSPISNIRTNLDARIRIGLACIFSVGLCFAYAATRSTWGNEWYRSHGGGLPYVAFWILLIGIFFPDRKHCARICIATVIVVCGLEFLQLWNPEPLASFRRTMFGAALLGSTFVWNDIPPYFLGGITGGAILWLLGPISIQARSASE